ncbi:MAG TPA: efflux RND transporter periplasmic adaptor subunit [Roseiflexaceae bacterium]|nr:efflux RND transporter periplasmic adaptor subunit [Roseiflexaceae bacterium]
MNQRLIATSLLVGTLAIGLAACGAAPTETPPPAAAQATLAPVATVAPAPTTTAPEIDLGISGIGEIKAAQDADLVFQSQGTVAEVKVKEGDTVKKGDLLAILDLRAFDQQLHQAEAALANAKAQQDSLTEDPRPADAAAAAAQVRQAQAQLNAIRQGAKDPDRAQAQAALNAAQINLQSTKDRLSLAKTQAEAQVQQAALALTQAQARYAQAKEYWQYVQDTGNDPVVPSTTSSTGKKSPNKLSDGQRENYYSQFVQAEAALHQAEQAVQLAQQAAESARQGEISGIAAAEQQLAQAQATVDKINLPPDSAQLAAAQAGVAQAQAAQAKLTQAPREAQSAQAAAGVAQAQAALELAQINREHAEIRAPFDGVVATVNVDPGDPSATVGQPAIKLVDASNLHMDAQISDIDISKLAVGQPAEVRADARPDTVYKGKISYIAPTATTTGTIRTYLVRISLDQHDGLLAGMSARVDFVPNK